MTSEMITKLEAKGFKRWQKGAYDRLYINAGALGLVCTFYKTGNISSAVFGDREISNCEARRMRAAKTFVDVKTGRLYSDNRNCEEAAQAILNEVTDEVTV